MKRRSFLAKLGSAPVLAAPMLAAPMPAAVSPAGPESRAYSLSAAPNGDVYLLWIETESGRHSLRISRLSGERWLPVNTVATGGDDWFVNWADHPMVAAGPDGRLMASWSYRPSAAAGSKWGLATRMVVSRDHGKTWKTACDLGADNTADYSGFIGFSASASGFRTAYLDPATHGESQRDAAHVKTLRFAEFSASGEKTSDVLIDDDVCTCCPLATADAEAGPVVVYRDHEAGEVRDVSIVQRVDGKWTKPRPVHRDGWVINGCPVNGAVVQADGHRVAAAWFTAADGVPRVRLAFSDDGGALFRQPMQVDQGAPAGWAGIALLDDGGTAVSWLEKRPSEPGLGDVMLRVVDGDGKPGPARIIASATSGRETGIPQMVRSGDRLVFAWRADSRVRTRILSL